MCIAIAEQQLKNTSVDNSRSYRLGSSMEVSNTVTSSGTGFFYMGWDKGKFVNCWSYKNNAIQLFYFLLPRLLKTPELDFHSTEWRFYSCSSRLMLTIKVFLVLSYMINHIFFFFFFWFVSFTLFTNFANFKVSVKFNFRKILLPDEKWLPAMKTPPSNTCSKYSRLMLRKSPSYNFGVYPVHIF